MVGVIRKRDVLAHLKQFTESGEESDGQPKPRPFTARYGVNVIVDASDSDGPPIVFADVPSAANIFRSRLPRSLMLASTTSLSVDSNASSIAWFSG